MRAGEKVGKTLRELFCVHVNDRQVAKALGVWIGEAPKELSRDIFGKRVCKNWCQTFGRSAWRRYMYARSWRGAMVVKRLCKARCRVG